MDTPYRSALAIVLPLLIMSTFAHAQRNVHTVSEALSSPIPDHVLAQAVQRDDAILKGGQIGGKRVYLVTDERQKRVSVLASRLLKAMGETEGKWVVRVLDTNPKESNAFVTGGRYIYVMTGLIEEAASDDELAVVLGHEIGHSRLKHGLREQQDPWMNILRVVALAGALSKGDTAEKLSFYSQHLQNDYSREDEAEADALAACRTELDG